MQMQQSMDHNHSRARWHATRMNDRHVSPQPLHIRPESRRPAPPVLAMRSSFVDTYVPAKEEGK
jgi:hypothetical protein